MLVVFLLACSSTPDAPVLPRLAVVVPVDGPDAETGRAALEGVRFAAGFSMEVQTVDEADPEALRAAVADPLVVGAVAHVTESGAKTNLDFWSSADLPVVVTAPGRFTGVPRAVPDPERAARCAAGFVQDGWVVRTDTSAEGMATANTLRARFEAGVVQVIDDSAVSVQAGAAGDLPIAWAGRASAGGNYLRALRQVGSQVPFLAIGGYDQRFLVSAGRMAEGASVTSVGRASRNEDFVRSWIVKYGAAPSLPSLNAYDAAKLLIAAQTSGGGTRDGTRGALARVSVDGAGGPMHLDTDGVISPVLCARFTVKNGAFELGEIVEEPASEPAPQK